MTILIQLLYSLYFFCLIAGVLAVVPLDISTGFSLYIVDIIVLLSFPLVFFFCRKHQWQRAEWMIGQSGLLFLGVAVVGLIWSPVPMTGSQRWVASLYLLRWVAYAALYFLTRWVIEATYIRSSFILHGLRIVSVVLAGLGWIQYLLYPNLRNLAYLGWDPHLERIFSTYLDPNFFGLLLVLGLIVWSVPFFPEKQTSRAWQWGTIAFLVLTLLFTYSRSSYLTALAVVVFVSLLRRQWHAVGIVGGLFLLAIMVLPQPAGEGGNLWRVYTFFSRVQSWQKGMNIFTAHPLLGVGFTTIQYINPPPSADTPRVVNHAAAGIDNSLIFLAATTGIVGLSAYLFFLSWHIRATGVIGQLSLVAVLVHSLFQNSLFYVWVMLWLWLVVAADRKTQR